MVVEPVGHADAARSAEVSPVSGIDLTFGPERTARGNRARQIKIVAPRATCFSVSEG